MYSLYQSPIRETLQVEIYWKPHGFTRIFGKEYFYLIKEKKIWPFSFREFQAIGVEMPDNWDEVRKGLKKLKKEFGGKRGNIFFQLGFVNEITSFDNARAREQNIVGKVKSMRLHTRNLIHKETPLKLAFKENMPQTTIMINLSKNDDQLLKEMNNGCANRVKKAIKKGIKVRLWDHDDYDTFFKKRQVTANGKGFSTITKPQYDRLLQVLEEKQCGNIFISELDEEIIAGSICLYHGNTIVYLYGFTDRKYTNMGGHHYLKYAMFERARDRWFEYCDLMGWAPTGFPEHPLVGVSKFKESLWWMKREFYGNYDLVLNPLLYYLFKWFYYLKKSHLLNKLLFWKNKA